MSKGKLFKAGWVKDAHGLKGELYVQLFAKAADWLSSFERFWLETPEGTSEFQVTRAKPHRDGLIVKADGIEDRTSAENLKRAAFFIPEEILIAQPGEPIFLHQIQGFRVFDKDRELGEIQSFSSNGAQDLLNVRTAAGEILIPFVDAFLKEIDFENKSVFMDLPPGLEGEGEP